MPGEADLDEIEKMQEEAMAGVIIIIIIILIIIITINIILGQLRECKILCR